MGKTTLLAALKTVFPPHCLHCQMVHDQLQTPLCATCASLLEVRPILNEREVIRTFEAVGPARSLMSALKRGVSLESASLLAAYMGLQVAKSSLPLPDLIVPVPQAWWRRWQVGEDIVFQMALQLGKILERPVLPLLKRQKQLFRQDQLSTEERKLLSVEQFQWKMPFPLRGKTILLLDDTVTTGATLACCAQRLWEAAPARVIKMACLG